MTGAPPPAHAAAERVAREHYGRLVTIVASRTRDLAAAEDALAEAFRAALETWPARGAPGNPEGWLVTAARRAAGAAARKAATRATGADTLAILAEERAASDAAAWPDRRLGLMLACADPAVPEPARAPLMLQAVLGLTAQQIAGPFLCAPSAMGQRLSRAKARLRAAGARFAAPAPAEATDAALAPALDAIYAAFGIGWDDVADGGALAEEALWLGRVAAAQAPTSAEAQGLLALMLHAQARRPARRRPDGGYAPMDEQDAALWSRPRMAEAETTLARAAALGAPGRYQIEAAIQSAHAERAVTGRVDWAAVAGLYGWLWTTAPSAGAAAARAVALSRAGRVADATAALGAVDPARAPQSWWAAKAAVDAMAGRRGDADAAYARAIGLSADPAARRWLAERRAALQMRNVSSSKIATTTTTV